MSIPITKARNAFPGDRAVVFQATATDVAGKKWPAGTELTPKEAGADNAAGCNVQIYTNGARFEGSR